MIPKELEHMKPLKGDEKLERDSEYMGADDISPDIEPVLTIAHIYRGKVTLSRGKEVKNVLTFVEETVPGISEVRPLIVNSTNRQTLKKLYKQVTASALEGKQIQLYIEHGVRNPSNGELTDGIRIRDKKPVAGKTVKALKCAVCGKEIMPAGGFSAEQIAAGSKQKYGKAMCMECGQKAKAAAEAQAEDKAEQDDLAAELMAEAGE
jgi:DNA-directed RNA polymerase subunit RPC12/RpoP